MRGESQDGSAERRGPGRARRLLVMLLPPLLLLVLGAPWIARAPEPWKTFAALALSALSLAWVFWERPGRRAP